MAYQYFKEDMRLWGLAGARELQGLGTGQGLGLTG